MKTILQMVRDGDMIDVSVGSFGGKGSVLWDKWADRFTMATGATSAILFKSAMDTSGKTPADTNTPANQVPEGQRWDLTALRWHFQAPGGIALTAAVKAAFNAWAQSAVYIVSYGQLVIRSQPLWADLGSQLAQETAISTTLALQSSIPKRQEWVDIFPDETPIPLASNVVLDFQLRFAAIPSDLNGYFFGATFDRVKAIQGV